ncbi:enkurin [Drosophila grimshawi]|uniref:GH16392 n=1 Tax=Drosophila grimshawi TaxID=7222 RepID=B4IZC4_DROGR|nr:enkurin [Drosophila grimshawi]EDV96679.1 GH16392 [Drosophila grimshawi]
MSLVYITHHNENIFDLEREPEKPQNLFANPDDTAKKAAKFSKGLRDRLNMEYKKHSMQVLDDGVRLLSDAKKSHHRTMGCAHVPLDPPCAFLRKNQGVKWRRENMHVCPKGESMPPLPEMGKKMKKADMVPNFVLRNIKCARNTVRCPPPPRYVDTPGGTRQNLLNSGMVPQFVCRKDFGQVPVYIKKTKKLMNKLHVDCCKEQARLMEICGGVKPSDSLAAITQPIRTDSTPTEMPGMRIMDQAERDEILVGLRAHLNEMTKSYQSMSLLIDSENKRQRKRKLESDLRQVEQDILMLETTPIIYVSLY